MATIDTGSRARSFADIVPFRASAAARREPQVDRSGWFDQSQRQWFQPTRRGFIKGLVVGGMALSLLTLDWFPFARRARAEGYDIINGCNGLETIGYPDCEGCYPSTKCESCCDFFGGSYWHANRDNMALRPNECWADGGAQWADGWTWAAAGCGCPSGQSKKWKCHDGKLNYGYNWYNTICPLPHECY
jgi:hypothetical protein